MNLYFVSIDFWHVWMLQVFRTLKWISRVPLATCILLESQLKHSIKATYIPQQTPTNNWIHISNRSLRGVCVCVLLLAPFLLAPGTPKKTSSILHHHLLHPKLPMTPRSSEILMYGGNLSFAVESEQDRWIVLSNDGSSEQSWWRKLEIYFKIFKTIQTERKPCFFAITCVINNVGWWMFQWTVWLQNRKFGRLCEVFEVVVYP